MYILEFEVLHRAGIRHHAGDALSILKTTKTDQTKFKEDVSVLSIDLQPLKREEASVSFMHDNEVNDSNECIRLTTVYKIETSTEPKNRKTGSPHTMLYLRR